jgi:hypothetical protein
MSGSTNLRPKNYKLWLAKQAGVTGPHELVHGERESLIGGYRWQRSGLWVGRPGPHVGGDGT